MIERAPARVLHFPPRDPHVTDRRDRERLSAQCVRLVLLFQDRGRLSNRELAAVSLKYTSRISDLRDAGYLVVCTDDPAVDGLTWYTLRDLRMQPIRGASLSSQLESRTVVALRSDKHGRRWVIYKVAGRDGIVRCLLATWRAWATQVPTGRARKPAAAWKGREQLALASERGGRPVPRPGRAL